MRIANPFFGYFPLAGRSANRYVRILKRRRDRPTTKYDIVAEFADFWHWISIFGVFLLRVA
jgi:hypothetical protein